MQIYTFRQSLKRKTTGKRSLKPKLFVEIRIDDFFLLFLHPTNYRNHQIRRTIWSFDGTSPNMRKY